MELMKARKHTDWIDIEMFDNMGHYKLIQMRIRLRNNKKSFRIVDIGFVNDHGQKKSIYEKILSVTAYINQ